MSDRRVVVTGLGAVTPLGNTVPQSWKNLLASRSGIGPISLFDASRFPTQIAGEVKDFSASKWTAQNGRSRFMGRNSFFALEAAEEAVQDAALGEGGVKPERYGIYFGAGDGGFNFAEYAEILAGSVNGDGYSVDAGKYFKVSASKMTADSVVEQEPFQVVNHLSDHFGAQGVVSNCLTACAASSQAIGEAAELIRKGHADVMISGGSHSMIHPLGVAGFNLLTALSTRNDAPAQASRPFDKNRDGFVLSEGAAVLVLEEWEHARKRGAKIYAEFAGYGGSADAFRLTDPHPDGRGAIQAMRLCLSDARMNPEDIDYINAHGTSTELNDQIETFAVKQVFGSQAYQIPMSSIKSMLGHMIAAAGAVELIASILTIRDGVIPPTINYETKDEECDLDYVPNRAREQKVETVLSNSFGFGGQNISLIVKKFNG
ncbi:MAG: beta-ketoacyl-ACP synthase II [Candidatus Omnitrophota bacterium]